MDDAALAVLAFRAPRLRELDLSCTAAGAAAPQRVRALCAKLDGLQILRLESARLGAAAVAELLGIPPPVSVAAEGQSGQVHGPAALPARSGSEAARRGRPVLAGTVAGRDPLGTAALPAAAEGEGRADCSACGEAWPPPSWEFPPDGPQVPGPLATAAPALRVLVLTGGAGALAGLGLEAGALRLASLPAEACGWLERQQLPAPRQASGAPAAAQRPDDCMGSFRVHMVPGAPLDSTPEEPDPDGPDPGGLTLYLVDAPCPCARPRSTLPGFASAGNEFDSEGASPDWVHPKRRAPRPRLPVALADLPHLARFDERLRYSAPELLALRPVSALGTRPGRLAALPSELLAEGGVSSAGG